MLSALDQDRSRTFEDLRGFELFGVIRCDVNRIVSKGSKSPKKMADFLDSEAQESEVHMLLNFTPLSYVILKQMSPVLENSFH